MYATTVRLVQLFILGALALYASLVFLGNLMDYDSNYQFVKHVLSMDTTFPDNELTWRAITSKAMVDMVYWLIIAVEGVIAVLGWIGFAKIISRFKAAADQFNAAKAIGLYSFMLAIALWFVGFICIGSEWFAMWQSDIWNGKDTAMDIVAISGIFLIIYMLPAQIFAAKAADKSTK